MARRVQTLLEVAIQRGGTRKGLRVATFVSCWAITSRSLGRAITLDDYREWWRESERTAYRYQAEFRELFPELDTPQPIADVAIARASDALDRGVAGVGSLPASLLLA